MMKTIFGDDRTKERLARYYFSTKRWGLDVELYPRVMGLNPRALKGLSGYALAAKLRDAADWLERVARDLEDGEDAARGMEE